MKLVSDILIVIVALLHFFFLYLEMFLWDKPFGMKTFHMTEEVAKQSKTLAMNQGLYNGFLAAGLIWGLSMGEAGLEVKLFFLICIVVAGVYGGLTASRKILYIQALPAALAIALLIA